MKLPPLKALTYFNCAAARLSFKRAAAELHVTEGAVSRQIKLLEEYYACPLFNRLRHGVQLTDAGEKLVAVTGPALANIALVSEEIHSSSPVITLSATTSFAIRWLMPRMGEFEQCQNGCPIQLQTGQNLEITGNQGFDANIVYILGNPADPKVKSPNNSHFIMTEWLLPVCTPDYLPQGRPIVLTEMDKYKLLFNEATGRDWRLWAKYIQDTKVVFNKISFDKVLDTAIKFEHDDTAIQAAVAGHGIALANLAYIENELKLGSLVPAVQCEPVATGAHYFICDTERFNQPNVKAFYSWLVNASAYIKSVKE